MLYMCQNCVYNSPRSTNVSRHSDADVPSTEATVERRSEPQGRSHILLEGDCPCVASFLGAVSLMSSAAPGALDVCWGGSSYWGSSWPGIPPCMPPSSPTKVGPWSGP